MAAIIMRIDDLLHTEEGRQVQADKTHEISVDGVAFEIDLTTEHFTELRDFLERYQKAGKPVAMSGLAAKKKTHAPTPGDTPLKRAKLYRRRMRAFADSRPDLGKASYLTEGGNHQYTERLEKAYAAYEAEHGPYPLPGEPGYPAEPQ